MQSIQKERKLHITIVCDVLGERNNGTTLATMHLIQHLQSRGHIVTVVTPQAVPGGQERYCVVPTLHLGKFLDKIVAHNGVTLAWPDEDILRKAIASADVVHIQVPLLLGCAAARLAREMGKPITASFHCQAENITAHVGLMNCTTVNRLLYHFFYHNVYQYCTRIHYPTEFIRKTFESEVGPTPAVVISNGVDEEFFQAAEQPLQPLPEEQDDKFLLVCSGRYSREKAQWQLIRAVAASRHKNNIRLVLAGMGPYADSLSHLAEELDVDCVQNFYSRKDLISLLRHADLYVHTAWVEIEAIACMEAIVCGLVPVICNSHRSATRFFALDERNLFEPEDIQDLTDKIDYWLEHPAEKKACAARYRNQSQEFTLSSCMARMETMLLDTANAVPFPIGQTIPEAQTETRRNEATLCE